MANQDVRVSALNSTSTLSTDDLSLETVVDELSETGYTSKKITEGAKASQYLEAFTFSNLNTTAKTIVGAINEAAESGGSGGGGRLDIEYDSTEETFNVTSDEIVEALENGFMLTFSSDETADGFLYTLNSVYPDGDEIVLFFNRFWTMGNGSGNPNNGDLFQCLVTVDTANDTVTFGGYSEVANVLSTIDNVTGQYNNWSASKIDTAIKQAIYNVLPTDTASGSVANFPDGADDVPVKSLTAQIVPTQEGTGDPSPSNVRPITGHSSVTISHSGEDTSDPEEIEIPLGQTVYGGELDATSGVLTVTFARVDLGTIDWRVLNTTNKFLYTQNQSLVPLAKPFSNATRATAKCEIYPTLSRSEIKYSAPFETGISIDISGEMLISDQNNTWSTIQEAQAELSGHYVVYELATPVEITLTPEQINTLYGTNNIWADTGEVSVEYRADVQKYIDKKIAEAVGGNRSLSLSKSAPEEVKEEKSEEKEETEEEGGNNER